MEAEFDELFEGGFGVGYEVEGAMEDGAEGSGLADEDSVAREVGGGVGVEDSEGDGLESVFGGFEPSEIESHGFEFAIGVVESAGSWAEHGDEGDARGYGVADGADGSGRGGEASEGECGVDFESVGAGDDGEARVVGGFDADFEEDAGGVRGLGHGGGWGVGVFGRGGLGYGIARGGWSVRFRFGFRFRYGDIRGGRD